MTSNQKKEAIYELARTLPAREIMRVSEHLEVVCEDVCEIEGHYPDNDHCGRPEHRFCRVCMKSMPNAVIPEIDNARQAKVDEAAVRKTAEPSESLGSGSKSFLSRLFGN